MTNHTYDSAAFESDLERVESAFEEILHCLNRPEFVDHVDATMRNFDGAAELIMLHENLLAELLVNKIAFEQFAEKIRSLG